MNKNDFCECTKVLREFSLWESKMYDCGIQLEHTPAADVAAMLHALMCDMNMDWSYDSKLGFDWIIEWIYTPESPDFTQTRHGRTFNLEDAGALYDFLVFMNEHGWEDG